MASDLAKVTGTIETAESVATASIEWASDTGGTVLNAAAGEQFVAVNIQVSLTFHGSATGDGKIHLRKSTDGGTTEDTEGDDTVALVVPVSAGATIIVGLSAYDFDYLDLAVENEDASQVLIYTATWEGYKLTGMS